MDININTWAELTKRMNGGIVSENWNPDDPASDSLDMGADQFDDENDFKDEVE